MKLKLLFTLSLFGVLSLNAQTILNGGFEYWNASSMDALNYYPNTSNPQALQLGLPPNVLKVADPQQGTLAIQLNTVTNGVDTMFGYFLNGDPSSGGGGIPYSQHPITLTGYYKSNIPLGDTGIFVVEFKEAGVTLSMDVAIFTGTHSTYTPFTVTLTIPPLANPDTVLIGAASSNAFVSNGIPGSMLQLDNLAFTGVSVQPTQMNGSFENWTAINTSTPLNWGTAGDMTYQTTDAHSGSYALMMSSFAYGPGAPSPSYATNGTFPPFSGPIGGRPYTLMTDTLCGWYKFTSVGVDSATIGVQLSNNGSSVGGAFLGLPPVSVYTFFSVPFSSFTAPDTLMAIFASSYDDISMSNVGSVLKVDDLYLKSSLVGTGPELNWNTFGQIQLYPNPSSVECWIEWTNNNHSPVMLTITDELGKIVFENSNSETGLQREHIDTSVLAKGSYTITLSQNGNRASRKLFVQ